VVEVKLKFFKEIKTDFKKEVGFFINIQDYNIMKVLKFGGTSVGTPENINRVIEIVCEQKKKNNGISVVASAFNGVTNQLTSIGTLAANAQEKFKDMLNDLELRHINAVKTLINVNKQSMILANVKMLINELDDVVKGVFLVQEISPRVLDFIMSFGERLSAYIICETIKDKGIKCEFLDARKLIITDDCFGNARVDFEVTNKNIKNYFKSHRALQIITGFIASTPNKQTTTLGRQGSDYTASIFGAALIASSIEIWTDVDGVMTADPQKVKRAFSISRLSYEEAMELSYFGAKVIYPPTMQPASERNIPIHIKNTFNPKAEGTIIGNKLFSNHHLIKGITSIREIAILRVQGSGMIGVAGISMRLFGALARKKINVILITQASSEHSICVAIDTKNSEAAKKVIKEEFSLEIATHRMEEVIVEGGLSIIAIVGENMRHRHGIAGRLFQSLGKNGINLVAIAQGSSELNISAVIDNQDETKALNVIHDAFFLSNTKSLNIFLLGTGLIGSTLLQQIEQQKNHLKEENGIDIRVVAVSNSKKMFFDYDGISIEHWKKLLEKSNNKMDVEKFIKNMKNANLSSSVFVDCTANAYNALTYTEILSSNISIVTPNKKACSGKYEYYKKLKDIAAEHNVRFLYETNVGAGLPIINTLNDLLTTGDKILKVEAILSGTLSYIFNSFSGNKHFSEVVREAKEKGYTEPDPRDDLNGMDVARKLLILSREIGLPIELSNIRIQSLISKKCIKAESINIFFKELMRMDDYFEKMKIDALKNKKVLRYIAILKGGKAEVSLKSVDSQHPFYPLSGSDNVISFTTERYKETPLVIKGPGAGAEVTAAGVFADILRISNYLM
jgi:aspartokinase/homoserine dehydrogenase 1